jgi:hypothetical protein
MPVTSAHASVLTFFPTGGTMWSLLLAVVTAGALGGLVNAFINDQGFRLPSVARVDGFTIYRPGWIGNVLVGGVAASVSWGLYGPLAAQNIIGPVGDEIVAVGLSLSSLVGAVLIGIGGARWLTDQVDKNLLKATAAKAAGSPGTATAAQQIAMASPSEALEIAKTM